MAPAAITGGRFDQHADPDPDTRVGYNGSSSGIPHTIGPQMKITTGTKIADILDIVCLHE
jgi:hypothetical protein